MLMGKVTGTVVASQKDEKLAALKLLVVETLNVEMEPAGSYHVAVDAVGAGVGEVVLYATGSSARQTTITEGRPADAVVMAIVDQFEIGGEVRYRKS